MTLRRLSLDDAPQLQLLLERCSDYYELAESVPTRPTAAIEELTDVPDGRSTDDKFTFGIYDGETLIGLLDMQRDYPREREWWIGFLIFAPEHRGRGEGGRVLEEACAWLAGQGCEKLWLAVLEQNPAAQRFWTRGGFEERERQDYVARSGQRNRVVLMRRSLR